ncbi:alpha/beta hydrolase [Actinoplanes ianthinogenes]|nr:alpha/beta hydrolase [Actinoplanes ianthinogenes]
MVHGMGVCDYLMPAVGALGLWTRAHLIDLPGCGGSADPPAELDVPGYARVVTDWLAERRLGPVVLAGQSSGTQVVAEAALRHRDVAGVALVCPTIDPAARSTPAVLWRWWLNRGREPHSLTEVHRPDVRRTGPRRYAHLFRVHLRHAIERPVARLTVPVLVLCGTGDPISPPDWGRWLAGVTPHGRYAETPGPHTFCWTAPAALSEPIRELTR